MPRFLAILALALIGLTTPALAHEYKAGALVLHHPWTRATPPGAEVAAVYVKIVNTGDTADRLVGIGSPIAETGAIHETITDGDVLKMRVVEGGVEIPAGATVVLEPNGIHGMLTKLKESLVEDAAVKATLTFEKAGAIEIDLVVGKLGAMEPTHN